MNDPDFKYAKNEKYENECREDKYDRYDRYDKYERKDKEEKRDKKDKKEVAIACGQVCDENLNILDCDHKCQVASLEIDLKHFKHPLVKLDFSSIVKFRDLDEGILGGISAANASFTLKLYRLTECCKKICIGTWDFKRNYNDIALGEVGLFLASTQDSFCFTKCDHPHCEDCTVYVIEVQETTRDENFLTKLVLTQINFNAIAVDEC